MAENTNPKKGRGFLVGMLFMAVLMIGLIALWLDPINLINIGVNGDDDHNQQATVPYNTPAPVPQVTEEVTGWVLTQVEFGPKIIQQLVNRTQTINACSFEQKVIEHCGVTSGNRLVYSSELLASLGNGVVPAEVSVSGYVEQQLSDYSESGQSREYVVQEGYIAEVAVQHNYVTNRMTGTVVDNLNRVMQGQVDYRTGACAIEIQTISKEPCAGFNPPVESQSTSDVVAPTQQPQVVVPTQAPTQDAASASVGASTNPMVGVVFESSAGIEYSAVWDGGTGWWLYQPFLPTTRLAHTLEVALWPGLTYSFNGVKCSLKDNEGNTIARNDNGLVFSTPVADDVLFYTVSCEADPVSGFSIETKSEPSQLPEWTYNPTTGAWKNLNTILAP